jgi:hypothetical protein
MYENLLHDILCADGHEVIRKRENECTNVPLRIRQFHSFKYSRTSNNGQCRGIQILSVVGGVR